MKTSPRTMLRYGTALIAMLLLSSLSLRAHAAGPHSLGPSLRKSDWLSIRSVISEQLKALKAGDAAKAMSFAAPGIRSQFGTPQNFIAMVRNGYVPLLAARYTEFLGGSVADGSVIQPLRLIAPDNAVLVALYTMEKQKDGRWKITGCVLAPSDVQAV